jgi:hypothetical protein
VFRRTPPSLPSIKVLSDEVRVNPSRCDDRGRTGPPPIPAGSVLAEKKRRRPDAFAFRIGDRNDLYLG